MAEVLIVGAGAAGLMAAGLLLLLAASVLSGYNLWDDRRAGRAAGEALEELSDRLDAAQEEKEGPETDPAERDVRRKAAHPPVSRFSEPSRCGSVQDRRAVRCRRGVPAR